MIAHYLRRSAVKPFLDLLLFHPRSLRRNFKIFLSLPPGKRQKYWKSRVPAWAAAAGTLRISNKADTAVLNKSGNT